MNNLYQINSDYEDIIMTYSHNQKDPELINNEFNYILIVILDAQKKADQNFGIARIRAIL